MTNRLFKTLRQDWLILGVIAALILFPFVVAWLTNSNPLGVLRGERYIMRGESVRWQSVLIEIYILAILAMSYNLLFGFTGVISFGHALFFGVGSYSVGIALQYLSLPPDVGLLVGVVGAIVFNILLGLFVGLVSLRLRGVYFAIFTLAIAEMFFVFFGRLELTRAEDGFALNAVPAWIDPAQSRLTLYFVTLALAAGVFVFIRRLIFSPTGAVFQAIRENEDRTRVIGYNTLTYKLMAITLSAVLAGVAGVLQAVLNKKVGPELLSVGYTVDPLLMTIIGGIGSFTGPIIGATGLHLLEILLRDAVISIPLGAEVLHIEIKAIWGLLLGAVFIAAVIVFPRGIVGTLRAWRTGRRSAPR
ncbi:MAG TPA: branched-chain amino acid ABC transporter permease [Aggregatilineales bacterium]|nr:branched-chain amino acid ABC transporter permease [Anaerolineales bacterium]HRE48731.1 branched-chain amino acid ABC transporter permease [Aggregatilineales bacterium]